MFKWGNRQILVPFTVLCFVSWWLLWCIRLSNAWVINHCWFFDCWLQAEGCMGLQEVDVGDWKRCHVTFFSQASFCDQLCRCFLNQLWFVKEKSCREGPCLHYEMGQLIRHSVKPTSTHSFQQEGFKNGIINSMQFLPQRKLALITHNYDTKTKKKVSFLPLR